MSTGLSSFLLPFGKDWRLLGRGCCAEVYRVRHLESGVDVAIKKFFGRDMEATRQLRNELSILDQLSHDNITKIYSCFQENEVGYIVMQLCEGGTVADRLGGEGYTEEDASVVIHSVTKALAYLHSMKVFHRDVTCANILYESEAEDSKVLLCDFGVSKISDGSARTRVGTKGYMAPEILQGHCYDEKCDIWSLGIVTYYMLAGELPFPTSDMEAVHLRKMKNGDYKCPSYFSPEVVDFIARCLASNPSERPGANELLQHPWLAQWN